jgi:hypothetical protein
MQVWEEPTESNEDREMSKFPEMEMEYYRQMMEPVDEERVSEEEVNRREDLREVSERDGGLGRISERGMVG